MNLAERLVYFKRGGTGLEETIWKSIEQYLIEIAKEKASGCFIVFDISEKIGNDFDFYYLAKIITNDKIGYYYLSNGITGYTIILKWDLFSKRLAEGKFEFRQVSDKLIRVTINEDRSFNIKLEDVDKEAMSKLNKEYGFSYVC